MFPGFLGVQGHSHLDVSIVQTLFWERLLIGAFVCPSTIYSGLGHLHVETLFTHGSYQDSHYVVFGVVVCLSTIYSGLGHLLV